MPLIQGNLRQVPMEEVRLCIPFEFIGLIYFGVMQNLREEVAMDVDEDEEGTQRPKRVADFGIEVNFDDVDDEEREVRFSESSIEVGD